MATHNFDCPACGAAMHIDAAKALFVCEYCGNTEPLDRVTADRLNKQDDKEVALERLKFEREMEERRARERAEQAARTEKQRKNKAIRDGVSNAGRKIRRIVFGIIALFFVVGLIGVAFNAIEDSNYEKERAERLSNPYTWPSTGLATLIDPPATDKGYISVNNNDRFEITIKAESTDDLYNYTQSVIARGFTVDAKTKTSGYEAFDKDGNKVELYLYTYNNELEITVYAATPRNTIAWPTYGVGASIPAPPSLIGSVRGQETDSFSVYVCDMDANATNIYFDECIAAGFTYDMSRSSDYLNAKNADGINLSIHCEGFDTIYVRVNKR